MKLQNVKIQNCQKKIHPIQMYVTSRVFGVRSSYFQTFLLDAETFKNTIFPRNFENRYPPFWVPQVSRQKNYLLEQIVGF